MLPAGRVVPKGRASGDEAQEERLRELFLRNQSQEEGSQRTFVELQRLGILQEPPRILESGLYRLLQPVLRFHLENLRRLSGG